MTSATRKARIGRAFGRAAARTYDDHAGVQAEVAGELARLILAPDARPHAPAHAATAAPSGASPPATALDPGVSFPPAAGCSSLSGGSSPGAATAASPNVSTGVSPAAPEAAPLSVLEIGCGTGFLAGLLLAAGTVGPYLCTDLSPAMVRRCRARLARAGLQAPPALQPTGRPHVPPAVLYAVMDAEAPAAAGPFDLVASSMALQWTTDLGRTLAGLGRLVRPSGRLVLAMPGADTFREWRSALDGQACGIPDFPTADVLRRLAPAGFSGPVTEQRRVVEYGSGLDFLRALKAMGAAQPRPGYRPMPPAALRAGLARLDSAGPRLTWHILYAVLRKGPDPTVPDKGKHA